MAITDYTLDLKDGMDAHYGVGLWTYRTGVGVGSDIGPALSAMITTIRGLQRKRGKISIGPGDWLLSTSGIDFSGIQLEGCGSQATAVWLNFSGAVTGFAFSGNDGSGNSVDGGGMKGIAVKLETGQGNTSVYGIYLKGNATLQPDQMLFEDIYMTGSDSSYFWDGFHADGTGRTSPQGIRIASLHNIQVFNCRNTSFYGANIVGWDIHNFGCYSAAAGTNGADFYITGGGSGSTNSTEVSVSRLNCGGTVHLSNASVLYVEGSWAALSNTATSTNTVNS